MINMVFGPESFPKNVYLLRVSHSALEAEIS